MIYKILSLNNKLLDKAKHVFNILNMKESIHIQDIDFYLIDVQTITKNNLDSYKNKNVFMLFITNNNNDIKLCLENQFTNYIHNTFSLDELMFWCKYFLNKSKTSLISINSHTILDLENKQAKIKDKKILFTKQEILLLNTLKHNKFVSTNTLKQNLELSSNTSVRTIINRIRKKTYQDFFLQKKDYGYKLNIQETKTTITNSNEKDLIQQNKLLQEIIDNSNIFLLTFIHKELYCINKSFRNYLGKDIIKELWTEEKGEFFLLIKCKKDEYKDLKNKLLSKGSHKVTLYNKKNLEDFEIKTYYFEKLDKHLLLFNKLAT